MLCHSNAEAQTVANALVSMGVPASTSRIGLLETPECALTMACMRRLADSTDILASAEILTLTTGQNPEHWLEDRFNALENNQHFEWADTACDPLRKLAEARTNISSLSPKEALITALRAADVHQTVVAWREDRRLTDHRLANLQHLVELADAYEDHCYANHSARSIGGFILWLQDKEQSLADAQATDAGNAVNVLTYHSAKGLEWPIVICSSLNREIKVRPYGIQVLPSTEPFKWDDPLKGRVIQYLPDPFPDQRQNDPLTNTLKSKPAWALSEQRERDVALRLLYVGITRACDHLILTDTREDMVGRWLSVLNSPLLPLKDGELTLPCGNSVTVVRQKIDPPDERPSFSPRQRHWLTPATSTPEEKLEYYHPPSSEPALANAEAQVVHDFGWRITLNGRPQMDDLGETVHQGLSTCLNIPDISLEVIANMINQRSPGALAAEDIQQRAEELRQWIEQRFPNSRLHTELPFSYHQENGQFCSGQIDLAVETEEGWIVIDHKSNPQPAAEWPQIALKHSGQLSAYSQALTALSGKTVLEAHIHFAIAGGITQVTWDMAE